MTSRNIIISDTFESITMISVPADSPPLVFTAVREISGLDINKNELHAVK